MEKELQNLFAQQLHLEEHSDYLFQVVQNHRVMIVMYDCALQEIETKFDVLNREMSVRSKRNLIKYTETRIKKPASILGKLRALGLDYSVETVVDNLHDIAGIRVICPYVEDIYGVSKMLADQNDIRVIKTKDYIASPKTNGYRSYHMIVEVPVFFSDKTQLMKVEVQLRTVAMDYWASLEHQLKYKKKIENTEEVVGRLRKCAKDIAVLEEEMQEIRNIIALKE